NQPLAAITNYSRAGERFLSMPEPDLEEARYALREIGSEALRAGEIIRRLRRLVRGERGEREPTVINELLDELRLLTQADARAHGATLIFEPGEDIPPVEMDRVQITQALLNLIRNALEAVAERKDGQGRVTVRTRKHPEGQIEVSVCDNGPGVAPGILERLFDPFCTTKEAGTGLGLPMARTIAEAHGGSVTYRPANPGGACFELRLPVLGD